VAQIEAELRLAAALTSLREEAGLSQRQLADAIGVSQPRVAAIERSRNVTLQVLEKYVAALGGRLEVRVVKGKKSIALVAPEQSRAGSTRGRRRHLPQRASS
jgi:transcriptional regulator with XRE-family HTH domain